jgi:hypothetical protein
LLFGTYWGTLCEPIEKSRDLDGTFLEPLGIWSKFQISKKSKRI